VRLRIEVREQGEIGVLRCLGALVYGAETEFLRAKSAEVISRCRYLVVNLAEASHLDAGGLGLLAWLHGEAQIWQRSLKFSCTPGRVYTLLQMSGIARLLEIYPSEEAAIQACPQAALP
jgi:anti-anti-sigma factor